ncbi:family 2 glycosyl transferase [Jeotgalibaca caeni]|uniref:family 2 glycosyl transferase n=1 Tax=Jeotgalibaca caeni TaxID=3028623 RepID=UPI00237DD6B5|nr:family 2 glycosyl transferase [Jeotgalibaca caeni]MDE1549291.1 family 2 glycosyl transferase [Jeotgalibaca caeni]
MKKKNSMIFLGMIAILVVAVLFYRTQFAEPKEPYYARVTDEAYEVLIDGEWQAVPIKGVNMGIAKPGYFPGESAITEEEYSRWFEMIGEMNANNIRVYTLHPPEFYQAFKKYNDTHEEKIYLFHGVWVNEEMLIEAQDAYDEETLADFQEEIQHVVAAIHGDITVPERVGHSHGKYKADISQYVIGWMVGIEWDPHVVVSTNELHQGIGEYQGTLFETKDASPFEHWLAEQMDYISTYEKENYDVIRPTSFTNWVTTDLLTHPSDTSGKEDLVSVDPNHIYPVNEMEEVGEFASYHVYPYYPEYLIYDQKYQDVLDHRGEENQYASYLKELKEQHRMPIIVAEFGVPSSRGRTHTGPNGKHQGFISEEEQGEVTSDLFEDIMEAGYLGGIVFSWQDEWFKRTWNTMDYDNPDRRPYWSNAQTSEQQFGILSFDTHKIQVDGETADWEEHEPIYTAKEGPLNEMYIDHDERYLYLRLDYDAGEEGYPVFLFDTIQDQGNHTIAGLNGSTFTNGIDFIANMHPDESRLLIDAYYDFYNYQYGMMLDFIEADPANPVKNSGQFRPLYYVLNRAIELADTNETIPYEDYETGKLLPGNGNPAADDYNSLADYAQTEAGVLELRIPWLLLQFRDPSQKEVMGDLVEEGATASQFIDALSVGVLFLDDKEEVITSFPAQKNQKIPTLHPYTWEKWDIPPSEERLKDSYDLLKETFDAY